MNNSWTWIAGSNTTGATGTYVSIGVAGTPGARYGSMSWIDGGGGLWLFGGTNGSAYYNDLWKFDGSSWIWESGSSGTNATGTYSGGSQVPGARANAVSWTDGSGNLWLFGGTGYDSAGTKGYLNDLWKYVPGTGWTFVTGSSTANSTGTYGSIGSTGTPGARTSAISWIDGSGTLWLFGGYGFDFTTTDGYLSDLWKYSGGNWTLVAGGTTFNLTGTYPASTGMGGTNYYPSSRGKAATWTDSGGNLWLFGGVSGLGNFNDLWKYNPSTTVWTWMSGSSSAGATAVYGIPGTAAADNVPSARYGSASWIDSSGTLWLFSGVSSPNDLWNFNPSTAYWTWVSGSNSAHVATYGTLGTASTGNVPGSRYLGVTWIDSGGRLWLFGGIGYDSSSTGNLNDLWRYQP